VSLPTQLLYPTRSGNYSFTCTHATTARYKSHKGLYTYTHTHTHTHTTDMHMNSHMTQHAHTHMAHTHIWHTHTLTCTHIQVAHTHMVHTCTLTQRWHTHTCTHTHTHINACIPVTAVPVLILPMLVRLSWRPGVHLRYLVPSGMTVGESGSRGSEEG